jgi:D-glycero-D-manno-heptose 1,7-bisphosphate phosphatase
MTRVGLALLDRDGTLNRRAPLGEYVTSPEEVELLPGAPRAVRRFNDAGVAVAVVTNQRGIALGRMSETALDAVHARLAEALQSEAGAHVDAFYHCPHEIGACACRKPEPGLLARAARQFGAQPPDSVVIGDAASDVEAGRRFGARTVQLTLAPSEADLTAPDLGAAVEAVLAPRAALFGQAPTGSIPSGSFGRSPGGTFGRTPSGSSGPPPSGSFGRAPRAGRRAAVR